MWHPCHDSSGPCQPKVASNYRLPGKRTIPFAHASRCNVCHIVSGVACALRRLKLSTRMSPTSARAFGAFCSSRCGASGSERGASCASMRVTGCSNPEWPGPPKSLTLRGDLESVFPPAKRAGGARVFAMRACARRAGLTAEPDSDSDLCRSHLCWYKVSPPEWRRIRRNGAPAKF